MPRAGRIVVAVRWGRPIRSLFPTIAVYLLSAVTAWGDTPANWVSPLSGNWTTASRWSTNPAYPNNGSVSYAPQIAATGGTYTVTLSTSVTVDSVLLNSPTATLDVNGGTLNVANLTAQSGSLSIDGASSSIVGATLTQGAGATLYLEGTLDNVKLGSDITLPEISPLNITIKNGLNLNGHNLNVIAGPNFSVSDSTGFTNNGTITINGLANSSNLSTAFYSPSSTLTISPGVTIQTGTLPTNGSNGIYVGAGSTGNTGNSLLEGTISSQTAGVAVYIKGTWTNTGTLKVFNGGILNLGGNFTTAGIGTLVNSGGTLQVTGNWDNTGATYTVNPAVGNISFPTGTLNAAITGGTINATGGSFLNLPAGGALTVSGLNLGAPVSVGQDAILTMANTVNLLNNTLTFAGGSGFNLNGSTLVVTGANLTGTGTFVFNGTTQPSLVMAYNSSQVTTIGPGITFQAGTGGTAIQAGSGGMNFNGTIVTGSGVQAITMAGTINFSGSVTVLAGGAFTAPSVANFSSGVLSNATYIVNSSGVLRLPGANVVTDNASITLNGANSNIYSSATANTDALAGLSSIMSAGSLTVTGGRSYSLAGPLTSQGAITVGSGSGLAVSGGLSTAGSGRLQGTGTVTANVLNGATLDPGGPTGLLTLSGALTDTSTGDTSFLINSPSDFASLQINGLASLNGTLMVSTGSTFSPAFGQSFQLFKFAGGETGAFTSMNLPSLNYPLRWDTSMVYSTGRISIAVPEPTSSLLLAAALPALLALGLMRYRKKRRSVR